MPACAAPNATKVATSNARTRITRMSPLSLAKLSARLALSWNAASGTTPARAITGSASSRMRPLGTAKVSGADMGAALGKRGRKGNGDGGSAGHGDHRRARGDRLAGRPRREGGGAEHRARGAGPAGYPRHAYHPGAADHRVAGAEPRGRAAPAGRRRLSLACPERGGPPA